MLIVLSVQRYEDTGKYPNILREFFLNDLFPLRQQLADVETLYM